MFIICFPFIKGTLLPNLCLLSNREVENHFGMKKISFYSLHFIQKYKCNENNEEEKYINQFNDFGVEHDKKETLLMTEK